MTENNNFYFWLGADGELEDLTNEEFESRVELDRALQSRWENASVGDASDILDGGTLV